MTVTERARVHRKRRGQVIATAVIVAAAASTTIACDEDQPQNVPAAATSLPDRDAPTRERLLPLATETQRRPAPQPAHIGTALVIRHLDVTEYCFEGTRTSRDKWPTIGIAAVKEATGIPYGARLTIAGKTYVVADREPPWGVSDVDLYAGRGPSCRRHAKNFGIRRLPVEIEEAA